MAEIRQSLAYAAAQSYIGVALQLGSTVVLSRVLTPQEVGTFAVAAVFSALASNFRDFGIAEYLIQAKQVSTQQIRAAFTVQIAVSWLMALLLAAGAGFAGDFYRAPQVADVMRVQALNFVLIPFGAINMAWFRRQMEFKPQFIASVSADVVQLSLAIALALAGLGPLALAWSSLAGIVVTVLVSVLYRPADFPRWPGFQGLREVLRFGGFASSIYALGQLGKSAPEMVIGRVQDVTAVAIFSRAGGLVQLFRQLVVRAIMPVCMPYFAQVVRDENNVNRAYLRSVAIFSVVGWTFLGYLGLEAFGTIRVVYGNQWEASVPLAQILCAAGAVELVHYLAKEALIAQGAIGLATRLQLQLQLAQVLGLLAVVPFGLAGAAWGMLGAALAGLLLSQQVMRHGSGWSWGQLREACQRSALVSLAALAAPAAVCLLWPVSAANYLWHLALTGVLTTAGWLLALRASAHPLWQELAAAGRSLRRRLPAAPGRGARP